MQQDACQYKAEVYFNGYYKEIELRNGTDSAVSIGTSKGSNVRLDRDRFFCDVDLTIYSTEGGIWKISCGNDIYLSKNDSVRHHILSLVHGKECSVHYEDGGACICRILFLREFASEGEHLFKYIDLSKLSEIHLGASNDCQILIDDKNLGNGEIMMHRTGNHWQLLDKGSCEIYDYDFFSITGHDFHIKGKRLYVSSAPEVSVRFEKVYEQRESMSSMEYPHLNRSTRMYYKLPNEKLKIQNPPGKQEPPDQNIVVMLMPMVVMALVIILLRGVMGGGGYFIIFSVVSMSVGGITSVYNYRHQKKKAKLQEEKRIATYHDYIAGKEKSIRELRKKETEFLEENTPDIKKTMDSVWDFDGRLYERRPEHEDFLSVRIGTGTIESACPVEYTPQEYRAAEDPLIDLPEQVEKKYHYIDNVPILLPLDSTPTVGIVGDKSFCYETIKLMTMDLCVHHSYQELELGYIFAEEEKEKYEWLRWLRHVSNPLTGVRNIAYDNGSYRNLVEFLYKEIAERAASQKNKEEKQIPHYVIFVMEPFELLNHPISRFFSDEQCYGFTFIFCSEYREQLPFCRKLVTFNNVNNLQVGFISDAFDSGKAQSYQPATVENQAAMRAAKKLASVNIDEISLDKQLTKSITLYKLLNIYTAEDLNLESRWSAAEVYKSLAAPLGINARNEVISLDICEKAHGPHGLVAGTTGSGKSETLQSYILSMATLYHPYEVGFVLIDFKGGGMANQFKSLPHLLGSITDIDGREIQRSLLSIRAELDRRKELFAEADVSNIDDYIRKFRRGEVSVALPHLVLIVDEFAELKADQPEFMKELVSAARIGRSLGVHLILATQKPAGVVDAQIWSNSRFKLCLKVQSPEDSNEMLKTPLAAEIKEPGRAYLQIGNNEYFELFQSAYSGGPAEQEMKADSRNYELYSVSLSGVKKLVFKKKGEKKDENAPTELQALVEYIAEYFKKSGQKPLNGICLPALKEVYNLPDYFDYERKTTGYFVQLGIYDAPEKQQQPVFGVNLSSQNILIIGSQQYGKSNILQSIIKQLSSKYMPEQVCFYIMDFATLTLSSMANLPHVGGIVHPGEDEGVKNLFKLIRDEIVRRKKRLETTGFSSFAAYLDAGYTDLSQIVLVVDNFTALKELYLMEDSEFLGFCRDGVSLGICCIMTNAQMSGISYKYLSNFAVRIGLFCNESSEYMTMFGNSKIRPRQAAGRFITEIDRTIYEGQAYLAFEGKRERDRVEAINQFVDAQRTRCAGRRARSIPSIPELLTQNFMREQHPEIFRPYNAVVGLDYANVSAVGIDLSSGGALGIVGKEKSGRGNWVRSVISDLQTNLELAPVKLYVVDDIARKYSTFEKLPFTEAYSILPEKFGEYVHECFKTLSERYEKMMEGDFDSMVNSELLVILVQSREAAAMLTTDIVLLGEYKDIVGKYKNLKATVIFANIENNRINYESPEPYRMLADHPNFLIFDDLINVKLFDPPYDALKIYKKALLPGEVYYLHENSCSKLRTPLVSADRKSQPV